MEENESLAVREKVIEPVVEENGSGNGHQALLPAKNLPVSKHLSNEQLIAEEKSLIEKETEVEKNYQGARGYLRLSHVSRVIGMLSLYLYLDQYDLHRAQHVKQAETRLEIARKLTWLAVLGEKFHHVNLWFFHQFILLLRRFFIGAESSKELNQERQAVWLKDNLIELGPTFIKIGQSMGTRADLCRCRSSRL